VSGEQALIDTLRQIATHPAARGLMDDAAVMLVRAGAIVLTHDMLVEGVHFLPGDPPASVAWKLLAVNLSDLAAKGARPIGALMGYALRGDPDWDAAFLHGLAEALSHFDVPLLGGDTVSAPHRMLSMTLVGEALAASPSRSGARAGDLLYVTGTIGDAGAGLALCDAGKLVPHDLVDAYRRPMPQLAAGQALAPHVTAMMDVSDGLLIDAQRMAVASDVAIEIALDAVPLSPARIALHGKGRASRLNAATAGDDYQLLFTASGPLPAIPCDVTQIGRVVTGSGLRIVIGGQELPLPRTLGWEHGV
jgi:thiamine-monophosphate kinase